MRSYGLDNDWSLEYGVGAVGTHGGEMGRKIVHKVHNVLNLPQPKLPLDVLATEYHNSATFIDPIFRGITEKMSFLLYDFIWRYCLFVGIFP